MGLRAFLAVVASAAMMLAACSSSNDDSPEASTTVTLQGDFEGESTGLVEVPSGYTLEESKVFSDQSFYTVEQSYSGVDKEGEPVGSMSVWRFQDGIDSETRDQMIASETTDLYGDDGGRAVAVDIGGVTWYESNLAGGRLKKSSRYVEDIDALATLDVFVANVDAAKEFLATWDAMPTSGKTDLANAPLGYAFGPSDATQAWMAGTIVDADGNDVAQVFATMFGTDMVAQGAAGAMANLYGADGGQAVPVEIGELTWYRTAEPDGSEEYAAVDVKTRVLVDVSGLSADDQAQTEELLGALEMANG